jgi:hypothetical protein
MGRQPRTCCQSQSQGLCCHDTGFSYPLRFSLALIYQPFILYMESGSKSPDATPIPSTRWPKCSVNILLHSQTNAYSTWKTQTPSCKIPKNCDRADCKREEKREFDVYVYLWKVLVHYDTRIWLTGMWIILMK